MWSGNGGVHAITPQRRASDRTCIHCKSCSIIAAPTGTEAGYPSGELASWIAGAVAYAVTPWVLQMDIRVIGFVSRAGY